MKIAEVLDALGNASAENPVGEDSLLPYWTHFWGPDGGAALGPSGRVRVFLLHLFFHYLNHNAARTAVVADLGWPSEALALARRNTRPDIALFAGWDAFEAAQDDAFSLVGHFSEVNGAAHDLSGGGRPGAQARDRAAAAHLQIFLLPDMGSAARRISVERDDDADAPRLTLVRPYDMLVGFRE